MKCSLIPGTVSLCEVFLKAMSAVLEECRLGTRDMFLNEDRDDVAFLTGSGSSKYIEEVYCKYRRKGKGRRCCLGDNIHSIPYRASYFALGRLEE